MIAVDIGNSHIGFHTSYSLPIVKETPIRSVSYSCQDHVDLDHVDLEQVLAELDLRLGDSHAWWLASVNKPVADQLQKLICATRGKTDSMHWVTQAMVPLADQIENRGTVGIDRLLVAWNAWTELPSDMRSPTGIVVVDAGSAVTVDWVDAGGCFCGGMIYPGLRLSAEALHRGTAALPATDAISQVPSPLGTNTDKAIQAGVYWSQLGGLLESVRVLQDYALHDKQVDKALLQRPTVVVTGGGLRPFLEYCPAGWRYEPLLLARAILRVAHQQGDE